MAKRGRPPKGEFEADVEAAVMESIRRGIVEDKKQKRPNRPLKAEEVAQGIHRELVDKANESPGWASLKGIASLRTIAYRLKRFKKNADLSRP